MKIPGLTFSLKRALGVTQTKQQFARKTGIPTSKAGFERKVGNFIIKFYLAKSRHEKVYHSFSRISAYFMYQK